MNTRHAVVKEYDHGRFDVIRAGLTLDEAAKEAGRLRDAMTDEEVGLSVDEWWSFQARYLRPGQR